MQDLDDQAALISALDLVITVPNTTMHLAGAVGASVRLLFAQEWRNLWVYKGEQVPWYPTVRVYAKSPDAMWDNALSLVQRDIESLATEPKAVRRPTI
jgi:ADP-heptose:LPS heptosyltransferase